MPQGKLLTAADDQAYSNDLAAMMRLRLAREEVAKKSGPEMIASQFAEGAISPVKSLAARAATAVGVPPETLGPVLGSDVEDPGDIVRANQARQSAAFEQYPEGKVGFPARMAMGAAQNIPGMVGSGTAGGLPGMLAYYGATTYDQSYTAGVDAGLSKPDAHKAAARDAVVEVGITAIFSKVGLGGAESAITQSAKRQAVKQAVTDRFKQFALKEVTPEMVEESTIAVLQNVNSAYSEIDPDAADAGNQLQSIAEASAQSIITLGMIKAGKGAVGAVENAQTGMARKKRLEELLEARRVRLQQEEESRQRAQGQLDEETPAPPEAPESTETPPPAETTEMPAEPPAAESEQDTPEFQPFPEESGSLGVPRAEMPQIKSEQRGALSQYARSRGVEFEREETLPGDLKPTQAEYSPAKVDKARSYDGPERAIIVSKDGYVIDGHHQWMKGLTDEPDRPIPIVRLGANAQEALDLVRNFPSSSTDAQSESEPAQTGAEPATTESPEAPPVDDASGNLPTDETSDSASGEDTVTTQPETAAETPTPEFAVQGATISNVDVESLKVEPERFQFKENANKSGVVEPLEGDFNPLAAGTILVWEDKDGNRYPVNGHHRTELARRQKVATLPAQIVRESDGVTADQARVLGAEINILEGQGTVDDYAQFFRESGIDEPQANERGLLARGKGKTGFVLGKYASDNTWAGFRAGKLPADKAAVIADIGRDDEGIQNLGTARAKNLTVDELRGFLQTVKSTPRTTEATQGDLFGFDDSAILEAEQLSKAAAEIIGEKKARVLAVRGALKRPEEARRMGLTGDMDQIRQQVEATKEDLARWERWYTDPELAKIARKRAGISDVETPPKKIGPQTSRGGDSNEEGLRDQEGRQEETEGQVDQPEAAAPPVETPAAPEEELSDIDKLVDAEFDAQTAPKPKKPKPTKKIGPQPPKKPKKKKPSISARRKKARQEADDLFNDFITKAKGKGLTGLDPELATIAVKYTLKELQYGALTFAEFAEKVYAKLPDEMRQKAVPYFESAWRRAHARGMTDDPGGRFSEVLTIVPDEQQQTTGSTKDMSPQQQDISLAKRAAKLLGTPDFDSKAFFSLADDVYGGSRAQGTYGDSRAYDALELAVNMRVSEMVSAADLTTRSVADVANVIGLIQDFLETVPRQRARTGEKDTLQQFSTPPHYGYVANWVANIRPTDVYLEPSGGVGGLAVFGKVAGADVYANEIDENRLSLMRELGFKGYHKQDADILAAALNGRVSPTVVVMNPPFSRAGRRHGNKKIIGTDRKQIQQALDLLPDGGRLVAIVGAGLHGQSKGMTKWLASSPYQVRANVEVNRDVYKGYGTTFPTRLLVFDKIPADPNVPTLNASVDTLTELAQTLEGIRNERSGNVEQTPSEREGDGSVDSPEANTGSNDDAQSPTGEPGGGRGSAGNGGGAKGGRPKRPNDGTSKRGGRSGRGTGKTGKRGKSSDGRSESGGTESTTGRVPDGVTARGISVTPITPESKKVEELSDSTYEPYAPSITVKGSQAHPASIVESAAMSAVNAPPITYTPSIDQSVIEGYTNENGENVGISIVQLEAIAAAGQSHQQLLPDGKTRRGYAIGDGTGVGKAREAAGIMLDNWNQGRKKAVWISKNFDLLGQAKEEWERVGGDPNDVLSHKNTKLGEPIGNTQGILFSTYGTIPRESGEDKPSRVDQLVNWLGEDFDGVIVFDEAHKMGNAIGSDKGSGRVAKEPSQTAKAGLALQERLPNARVVYMSATSATEVANLAYAPRLGLWGPGTQFADAKSFIDRITSGGVASMEVVASDMKAMGLYTSRNLAFDDGTKEGTVTFDRVEHNLTEDQTRGYDAASDAWISVLDNIEEALELTNNTNGRSFIMSQFWSKNQRFWNSVVMSMMVPTLIKNIETDMKNDKSVLIQLTSTGEAATERAMSRLKKDQSLEDVDVSPAYVLIELLEKAFPIHVHETFTDDNGNEQTRPALDRETGKKIVDPRAVAMRDALIDRVSRLPISNRSALDEIINHFGAKNVAEITGRRQRLVDKNGEVAVEKRGKNATGKDKEDFMNGKKRILIFSEAGGTGASYHADRTKENQQQRSHYLFQAGWRADIAVQGLGRGHRSNQSSAPILRLMEPNLHGYKRFVSTIARRLSQLGALTKGQRQAGDSGVFAAKDNLESTEATRALRQLFEDSIDGKIEGIDPDYFENRMGFKIVNKEGSALSSMPNMEKFLNRLLNLRTSEQAVLFEEFDRRLNEIVEAAIANDTLDQGLETIRSVGTKKVSEEVANVHSTGAITKHVVISVKEPVSVRSLDVAQKNYGKDLFGYFVSKKTGKVFLVSDAKATVQDSAGRYHPMGRQSGVESQRLSKLDNYKNTDNWREVSQQEGAALWNAEVEKHPGFVEKEMHLITGALLPVWNNLPDSNPKIKRALTEDGEQILGRVIDQEDLSDTLANLGMTYDGPQMDAGEAAAIVGRGGNLKLAGGWKVRMSSVEGEQMMELEGPTDSDFTVLQPTGVFSRRIGYRTRYFIPMDNPTPVLNHLMENGHAIIEVNRPKNRSNDYAEQMINAKRRKLGPMPKNARKANIIRRGDIVKTWHRLFDVPMRSGKTKRKTLGTYKSIDGRIAPEIVRLRESNNLDLLVDSHEIAHHIDRKMDLRARLRAFRRVDPIGHSIVLTQLKDLDYDNTRKASRDGGDVSEGIAEAFRHILTGTHTEGASHAKAIAWVHDEVLTHPVFGPAMAQAIQHVRQYDRMTPEDQILSQVGRTGQDLDRWQRARERFGQISFNGIREFVDESRVLKDIERFAKKKGYEGVGIEQAYLVYLMSAGSHASKAFENGLHSIRTLEPIGKHGVFSLAELVDNAEEEDKAIAYSYAKHTLFMQEKRKERGTGPYNSGIDPEVAKDFIAGLSDEEVAKYDRYALRISEILDDILEMRVDAGELTKKDADNIREYYGDNMFSLMRASDDDFKKAGARSFVNLPKSLLARSREGSDRPILHPVESLMRKIQQAYSSAARYRVSDILVQNLLGAEGMGVWGDEVAPGSTSFTFAIEEALRGLTENKIVTPEFAEDLKFARDIRLGTNVSQARIDSFAKRHGLDPKSDDFWSMADVVVMNTPDIMNLITLWRSDWTPNQQKATIVVRDRDGKNRMFSLERNLYELATGMRRENLPAWLNMLKASTKIFRAGAVNMSSGFGLFNLISDYLTFQSRSQYTVGPKTVLSPIEELLSVMVYKIGKSVGLPMDRWAPTNSLLVEMYEEGGGSLQSRIGYDIDSIGRGRRRAMRKLKHRRSLSEKLFYGPKETMMNVVDRMQDVIAISDMPPRLAEMRAYLKSKGYTIKGKQIFHEGQPVKALPEQIRIEMMSAGAEATVNFKRGGSTARVIDVFLPFFNASIQAHYRTAKQIKNMGTAERKKELFNTIAYMTAMIPAAIWYALDRVDDEDYQELESHDRDRFFTFGSDGVTDITIPKPRDTAIVFNLIEAAVAKLYEVELADKGSDLTDTMLRDLKGKVSTGGGPLRGAAEVWMNYDHFRQRAIEADYLKGKHKSLRTSPYTLKMSDEAGYQLGKSVGMSPLQFEHFMNSASGGAYSRWGRFAEGTVGVIGEKMGNQDLADVPKRKIGPRDVVPGMRAIYKGFFQSGSVNDVYEEASRLEQMIDLKASELGEPQNEAELEAYNKRYAEEIAPIEHRFHVLSDAQGVMSGIRKVEPKESGGARTFEYEPYINGIARDALGRPPLEHSPNPFTTTDPLPEPLHKMLVAKVNRMTEPAVALYDIPAKDTDEKPLRQRLREYEAMVKANRLWLMEHSDSPVIQEAIRNAKETKRYKDGAKALPRPKWDPKKETWAEHSAEMERYQLFQRLRRENTL